MELERDLHQADTMKLKEDMKTLVSKMFDISMYECSEPPPIDNNVDIRNNRDYGSRNGMEESHHACHEPSNTVLFPRTLTMKTNLNVSKTGALDEKMRVLGLVYQPKDLFCRSSMLSNPNFIEIDHRRQQSDSSDADNVCLLSSPNERQHARNQNIFRSKYDQTSRPCTESFQVDWNNIIRPHQRSKAKDTKGAILRRHQSLSAIDTKSTCLTSETKLGEEEKESRRCGMLFRRRSKRQPFLREDISIMKHQIKQLTDMMKSSLKGSEKLRKRIATISRYYEGVISKLQTKIAEVKAEKSRTEIYLTNRISHADFLISKFEHELQRKDKEIKRLKERGDCGEI